MESAASKLSTLQRLQRWYFAQCNEEWEHQQGIKIESCDNPGWWVQIGLTNTALENVAFPRVAENVDEEDFQLGPRWLTCDVKDNVWHGAGDETRLEQILQIFLAWAESTRGDV